ncbi:MAG: class I SAM-dependent RNA methyltransferase [Acidobacteria bacterium]|nr:class I SAM-dependent RNA methyltransferase [Acidobacteriota bacterium]
MARCKIEKLLYRGYGLGRTKGKALLVPRSAPGDLLETHIVESHRSYDIGKIEQVVESSAARVEPPCTFYKQGCGGCQWQHVHYSEQLESKRAILLELLERAHVLNPSIELEVIASPPFYYRARFSLRVTRRGQTALFRERSHEPVVLDYCWLLPDELNGLLQTLQGHPAIVGCHSLQLWINEQGQLGLETFPPLPKLKALELQWVIEPVLLLHPLLATRLVFTVEGLRYDVGPNSFFQTNRYLNPRLSRAVGDMAGSGDLVFDLYCGIGFFSLAVSLQFARVLGLDKNPANIVLAEANAIRNGRGNVSFLLADAASGLPVSEHADCIIVDPPRAGLSPKLLQEISERGPKRLVYVSCEPPTLARDLSRLKGFYHPVKTILLDLFPQTFHFETVTQLQHLD